MSGRRCSSSRRGYSRRSLQITRNCLERAIRQAEADDLVGRNVAALVKRADGRDGRPSKSSRWSRRKRCWLSRRAGVHAYVTLSLLVGLRTRRHVRCGGITSWSGSRAGRWLPVTAPEFKAAGPDVARFAIYVWRAERHGGDTKTGKSRRTLALPRACVDALREQLTAAGADRSRADEAWEDHGLVFTSRVGTPLTANNVIRAFRIITKAAGLGRTGCPGDEAHVRVGAVSERCPRGEHRPAGWARPDGDDGAGLPP